MTDIQHFQLPRDDWYDSDGRIYKDVIIENLNACENELLEIQGLDAFVVQPPDFSTIVYPDVTINSEENSIINLRSFLNMVNVINYPIELIISGLRIRKVAYWSDNYNYVVIENKNVAADSDNPYVYIDITTKEIKATGNPSIAASNIFLGVFENGKILGVHDKMKANLNLMYLLANIKKDTGTLSSPNVHSGVLFTNPDNKVRAVGYGDGESKSGARSMTYTDYGRAE